MNNPTRTTLLFLLISLLLLLLVPAAGAAPDETVITVDSGGDPDNSSSKTCLNASPCTLRRAIVQANKVSAGNRPVFIDFDIAQKASEGYDSASDAWIITLQAGTGTAVLPALTGGDIIIDGTTQPGDRFDGPKIFLRGPGDGGQDGLLLGESADGDDDFNEIVGIGFQNFRRSMVVSSNLNLILDNWFGMAADGSGVYLRDGDPTKGSGEIGVLVSAGAQENTLEINDFIGFVDAAVALNGSGNGLFDTLVGTDAEGLVPQTGTMAVPSCSQGDWLGGAGVRIAGTANEVADNTFVGLRVENGGGAQPDAISVSGDQHFLADNYIGIDFEGHEAGVCGRGIVLNDTQEVELLDNVIANPVRSAIALNGTAYDGNLLSGTLIGRQSPWPAGETAVQLAASLPEAFRAFKPAKVTSQSDDFIKGRSGEGSPCPNCVIEIFLDDKDNVAETLELVAVVTADANGFWEAELTQPIHPSNGFRTMSTTAADDTIPGMSDGTTSGLSQLYTPSEVIELNSFLPVVMGQ